MNIFVVLKMVPDTVEELNVSADSKSLDTEFLRFKLSEPDEHALEQALILKEQHGGKVTVVALDAPEVEDALFTALAKGADRAVRITIPQADSGTTASTAVLTAFLSAAGPIAPDTLFLSGTQAIDDLEGELTPRLAAALRLPHVGVVCGVKLAAGRATVLKEFAGGLRAEFETPLPAVLGVQSAEKPPRYVPVAKVRAAMKTARIETVDVAPPDRLRQIELERMYKPEAAGHAEMLAGDTHEVADRLVAVLVKAGVI
jgi:electron transfer flavoprotein beta subunit